MDERNKPSRPVSLFVTQYLPFWTIHKYISTFPLSILCTLKQPGIQNILHTDFVKWAISFCQLHTKYRYLGQKEPQLRNYLTQTVLWACLWNIFLVNNWYGKYQPTAGSGSAFRQVVLGCIRKASWASHEKQANKQHPSTASVSDPPGWRFLPWASALASQAGINPFLSNVFWS